MKPTGFDRLAPFYDRLVPRSAASPLPELLGLAADGVLLDAAGGTGRVSAPLAANVGRIVVCDVSETMLRQARLKGLETVQGEIEQLPFADETFDAVLLVDAFHHLNDQQAALRELLRVLKPRGRLVIEEPNIRRPLVKLIALLEKILLMRSRFYAPETILKMIAAAGGTARIASEDRFRVWITTGKTARIKVGT